MKNLSRNPFSFSPLSVTIITSLIYAALIIPLLVVHHIPPEAERLAGTNLTEAWLDLQSMSGGFHPYNSRSNDVVREYLLKRIDAIILKNSVRSSSFAFNHESLAYFHTNSEGSSVVVFSDITSNASFSESGTPGLPGISAYFEGTNIIVYIRGSEDQEGDWFLEGKKYEAQGGVLVNAHYDSVSTGFGITDDGMGVVTILQLIEYFSASGNRPKRGIVALLNNGEEDGLHGARAYAKHPLSRFTHTFLNLEGAGAGGRASLFRSTDTEVTRAYQNSGYPFGSVVSGDAFKRGVIRSGTDYSIFKDILGMRGLDVAFFQPRALYHTDQDDIPHSSKASLYHMLSAALGTMKALTSDTSSTFDSSDAEKGKVPSGTGSNAVWFDLFGAAFAVFRLHTLFVLSVTLLVVAPLTFIAIGVILQRKDKLYLFSSSKHHHHPEGDDSVAIQGWRGFFRHPVAFILSTAAAIGLGFLVNQINPYIIVSSPYAIWSMLISAWVFVAYVCMKSADAFRPTAFHRAYSLFWMFIAGWIVLVATTVFEHSAEIGGGYLIFFYFACIFLATTVSFLELFNLLPKSEYADDLEGSSPPDNPISRSRPGSISSARLLAPSAEEQPPENTESNAENDDDDATESTSLLGARQRRTTFKRYPSPHAPGPTATPIPESQTNRLVYGSEQPWSHALPSSLWFLEFLLLAPFPIIIFGQIALLLTSAMFQTPSDGNATLPIYLITAVLTTILFAPLSPFLHRYTYHIPLFLLLVFTGTTIYNLTAFPFSESNRLKLFFLQHIDLDTGINNVSLTGVNTGSYLRDAIHSLPSASGQPLSCSPSTRRLGLTECSWHGLPPHVIPALHTRNFTKPPAYKTWLTFNATRTSPSTAHFRISAPPESRNCKIEFDTPISDFSVAGAGAEHRYDKVSEGGSRELRLWSRTWGRVWDVGVSWREKDVERVKQLKQMKQVVRREQVQHRADGGVFRGKVVCLWSDANIPGRIPALDEARRFKPAWVAVTKNGDGLVEGSKGFTV